MTENGALRTENVAPLLPSLGALGWFHRRRSSRLRCVERLKVVLHAVLHILRHVFALHEGLELHFEGALFGFGFAVAHAGAVVGGFDFREAGPLTLLAFELGGVA